jgi:hypothetical protein
MPHLNSLPEIQYERPVGGHLRRRVDAVAGHLIFEYKPQIRDLRILQAGVMGLAQVLQEEPNRRAILIIENTRISEQRMEAEWKSYINLFNPSIVERLGIAIFEEEELVQVHGSLHQEEKKVMEEVRSKLSSKLPLRKKRSRDSFLDLSRVMLIKWFRGTGPLKVNQLCLLTGFSYPTVAAGLKKMERYLKRHSDRSVELKEFPGEIWQKLLADSETVRAPIALAAQKPRPIEVLLENLESYSAIEVGYGGIIGARHYLPRIDLIGIHRLDLTVKTVREERIQKLIRRLDPALKPVKSGQSCQVVIHRLFRPRTLFQDSPTGKVADEVECLLDLHEARLEQQATELMEHFIRKAKA